MWVQDNIFKKKIEAVINSVIKSESEGGIGGAQ